MSRPIRNRRAYTEANRPASASTKMASPGKNTSSFLECTCSRIGAVMEPHMRFSEDADRREAGPEE